ncbi:hypothetical protein [Streptomyces sp. NBC_00576]|nr:hypothetical protein [Streptomyces sp. NBC_00576]WUB69788.1 hypothetical protein OG734_06735 [Streptomyces sp. NBC_00576]
MTTTTNTTDPVDHTGPGAGREQRRADTEPGAPASAVPVRRPHP